MVSQWKHTMKEQYKAAAVITCTAFWLQTPVMEELTNTSVTSCKKQNVKCTTKKPRNYLATVYRDSQAASHAFEARCIAPAFRPLLQNSAQSLQIWTFAKRTLTITCCMITHSLHHYPFFFYDQCTTKVTKNKALHFMTYGSLLPLSRYALSLLHSCDTYSHSLDEPRMSGYSVRRKFQSHYMHHYSCPGVNQLDSLALKIA